MATTPRRNLTQAEQWRLSRRPGASGLLGLAGQFQKDINRLTSQYQTEFSQYQQRVAEMMAPYEQATQRFNEVDVPAYESYKQDYNAYVQKLFAYEPFVSQQVQRNFVSQTNLVYDPPSYQIIDPGGWEPGRGWDSTSNTFDPGTYRAPSFGFVTPPPRWETTATPRFNVGGQTLFEDQFESFLTSRGGFVDTEQGNTLTVRLPNEQPKPVFNRTEVPSPVAPTAPEIPEFDQSVFNQRRNQLQEGFKREVSERRSARMNAVQRRSRTMLQGV